MLEMIGWPSTAPTGQSSHASNTVYDYVIAHAFQPVESASQLVVAFWSSFASVVTQPRGPPHKQTFGEDDCEDGASVHSVLLH